MGSRGGDATHSTLARMFWGLCLCEDLDCLCGRACTLAHANKAIDLFGTLSELIVLPMMIDS